MCRYIHSIIKNHEGKLLMQSANDSWKTLGGEVEHGESPKEAFMRIACEGAGFLLSDIDLIDIIDDGKRQIHVFSASMDPNDQDYAEKSERFGFFDEEQLKSIRLTEHTEFILKKEKRFLQ